MNTVLLWAKQCAQAATAIALIAISASAGVIPSSTIDTTTQGNWIGKYGDQGYILSNYGLGTDVVSLPSYIGSFNLLGSLRHAWSTTSSEVRALQNPSDPVGLRTAACWFGDQTITLNPTASVHFQLGLYFLSWDNPSRAFDVTMAGGGLSGTDSVAHLDDGKWYLYDVNAISGSPITISLATTVSHNAVISALTFSSMSPSAVPEIDPAGIGSVLALVTGALGLLERRRLKAA